MTDRTDWQKIVAYDWVVTRVWNRLHHVTLTDDQWAEWEEGDVFPGPVRLSCGQTAATICVPGPMSRMGLWRCQGCCQVVGYPPGKGSPKNDVECRTILGLG